MTKKIITGILILLFPLVIIAQNDTLQKYKCCNRGKLIKSIAAPALLSTAGFITYKESGFLNKVQLQQYFHDHIGKTHSNIADYMSIAPIVAVYGLDLAGISAKNDFYNRTLLLLKSELISLIIVNGLKYSIGEIRPDSSDQLSFPSGHTAQAFVSATLMHKEFRNKSIWYSVAAYSTASAVGLLRILNNRHWTNDVLVGAATGILSVNIAYLTHRYKIFPDKRSAAMLYPYTDGKFSGLGLIWQL